MKPSNRHVVYKAVHSFVLIGSLTLIAQTAQGAVVYEQTDIGLMNVSGAVVSSADGPYFADDWPATAGSRIAKVTWWVQEFNGVSIGDFRIVIFNDNNGVPGQVLYNILIPEIDLTVIDFGQILSNLKLYQISADLPSAFEPFTGTYWISIAGVSNTDWRALLGDTPMTYRYNTHATASSLDGPWTTSEGVYDLAFRLEDTADGSGDAGDGADDTGGDIDCGPGTLGIMPIAMLGLCSLKAGFARTQRKRR